MATGRVEDNGPVTTVVPDRAERHHAVRRATTRNLAIAVRDFDDVE
ncbi:MAG: hypothetical protein QGG40_05200 [Myxococcota bacterium]|nr:hypothetical protein [Myxococcota bacterium]